MPQITLPGPLNVPRRNLWPAVFSCLPSWSMEPLVAGLRPGVPWLELLAELLGENHTDGALAIYAVWQEGEP